MWYKNVSICFFRFVRIHAFDRRMDGQKGLGNTVHCITCSGMVKSEITEIHIEQSGVELLTCHVLLGVITDQKGAWTDHEKHSTCQSRVAHNQTFSC